ncbi:MAG TPA: hypothetical protein VFZ53_13870 [Polyangiaceae bacterium]
MEPASLVLEAESPASFQPRALVRAVHREEISVRFVPGSEFETILAESASAGYLPVFVPAPKPAERGHLALLVEEAVELALERHGGSPPGLTTETDLDASLADQLYRARLLEFRGIAIALGPLSSLAGVPGILDVEDSAVLRFWCNAPKDRSVRLLLDSENAELGVYGPPRPLGDFVPAAASPLRVDCEPVPAGELARALVGALTDGTPEPCAESDAMPSAHSSEPPASGERDAAPAETSDAAPTETPDAARAASDAEPPLFNEEAPETSQIRPAPLGPLHENAAESWPGWLRELEAARGPKPLASIERMFAKSYVPLRDAYLRGIAPREVGSVLEGWATSFAKSYTETFNALRVRTKRPTMLLDVPDVALRIGRLHGARSVQLLLVDGLRFDLGLRFEAMLRERLGREVALAERLLLWSALPSDTATQLDLLGRGPDALRGLERADDSTVMVARGRMARVPRRVKAGHRELLKLDLVEAELGEPGGSETERLDALATPLTDAVAELCEKLPARTLLVVFGDHGFTFDTLSDGTTVARQGGARPEEVLVPAFAWLVGGVQ